MQSLDSQHLLAEYAQNDSDAAFRELVTRYIDLVYSTAVRAVQGDTQLAEDVTQTVFIDLARKARGLARGVMLGGWLYQRTQHVAATLMRSERRRHFREREAVAMNTPPHGSEGHLHPLAPLLDEAISRLGAEDRTAILLRFFEHLDFRAVGKALGSSEDAARMRVNRALERLHVLLKHQGVSLPSAALATTLAALVTSAPVGLAASVSSAALASPAVGSGIMLGLLKVMTMTKLKVAVGAVIVAGVGTVLVLEHQAQSRRREENASLRAEQRNLRSTENAPQASSPAAATEDYYPKESLTFAGYASPDSTLQSMGWASVQGDVAVLLACASPEERARLERAFQGRSEAEVAAKFRAETEPMQGIQILKRKTVSEDEVVLTISLKGKNDVTRLTFRRLGAEWKIAGEQKL